MGKGKKKAPKNDDENDQYATDDPFAWFACCLALILGIAMVTIDALSGHKCKLRDVDLASWNDNDQKGQIPLWMQAEGILFLVSSLFYIFGRFMRKTFKPVGNILTGICGKMTLFIIWSFTFLINLLGSFWLYLAKLYRTEDNAIAEGDPNYCTPEIWYMAESVTILFWIFSGISIIIVMGKLHSFILGPEHKLMRVVTIGANPNN